MVSGGLKVVVKNGRITREDLPAKIHPFVRIKAGSRIADSRKIAVESLKEDVWWNQSLSLAFRDDTQLMIQLLDSDKKIPNYHFEIGVCVLNIEMLQICQKTNIFGSFHTNSGKLAALIEFDITYEQTMEEKVEARPPSDRNTIRKAETLEEDEPQEPLYDKLTLNFKVLEARLTHDTEALGQMKPYCLIKLRQKEFRTDVLKGKNPKWNQLFIFDDIKPEMLVDVSIWDKETMKQDDLVGKGRLQIGDIMKQQSRQYEIALTYWQGNIQKRAGILRVQAKVF